MNSISEFQSRERKHQQIYYFERKVLAAIFELITRSLKRTITVGNSKPVSVLLYPGIGIVMSFCRLVSEDIRALLRKSPPKRVVLSGPSGFLGSRVLDYILQLHSDRIKHKLSPGEVVLLSSSPGRLMHRLTSKYGTEAMRTIRASRVNYYTQHDVDTWQDHLGSLSLGGENSVFVNLAGLAGPEKTHVDPFKAMMDVNYRSVIISLCIDQKCLYSNNM